MRQNRNRITAGIILLFMLFSISGCQLSCVRPTGVSAIRKTPYGPVDFFDVSNDLGKWIVENTSLDAVFLAGDSQARSVEIVQPGKDIKSVSCCPADPNHSAIDADMRKIYETGDCHIVRKYHIDYVFLGPEEERFATFCFEEWHTFKQVYTEKIWGKRFSIYRTACSGNFRKLIGDIYFLGDFKTRYGHWAAYLIHTSNGLILIDSGPAGLSPMLLSNIRESGFDPRDVKIILNTHGHGDHTGGNKKIIDISGAKVYIHELDAPHLEKSSDLVNCRYCFGKVPPCKVDKRLKDGDMVRLGNKALRVIHLPGHTPGSCAFLLAVKDGSEAKNVLFSGDVLFPHGSWGHWKNNPYEHVGKVLDSLKKLRRYTSENDIGINYLFPGHPFGAFYNKSPQDWNDLIDRAIESAKWHQFSHF